ncbi:trichohyalin-like [Bicyclus anynana]|uniref:Trichohyalin-like n=1 Tax=Bicyclus anynana TaxID=110368 RepID=A0ABM3LU01_BICAN|nr:trichohyalin-like [Bicyclus anynana]
MCEATQPRQKVPKDGPGPRGAPDCYYTSRVLNSTHRYAKFVRKLRAKEEEERKGAENKLKELKNRQTSFFFIHCDRRSCINNVARRVEFCMASYEADVKAKQERLKELLRLEEQEHMRKLVEQAQAGSEAAWQDKLARLRHLLDKRQKEHEDKYTDTPLSKCVHVLPCIYKLRAKEAEEIQLYQMKEKEARKMAEKEFDKMWHEVAMKESEALAARMEQDAIERTRRDYECNKYSQYQVEQNRIQREKERERLKEETRWFRALWDEENRKEEEAQRQRMEKSRKMAAERKQMLEERHEVLAQQEKEAKLISDTWDSLTGQGLAEQQAEVMLRRQKERELDECNRKLIELKKQFSERDKEVEGPIAEEARRRQEVTDAKRCEYMGWAQRTNREVRQAMIEQIKERQHASEVLKQKMQEQEEYERQQFAHTSQLCDHQALCDAAARKKHQLDLLQQIEYNKLLKERALQEELEQMKKCKMAAAEYENEIGRMLCRPFFCDEIHPFMKQMSSNLKMKEKCPCSKPDYCK